LYILACLLLAFSEWETIFFSTGRNADMTELIQKPDVEGKILVIRGKRVMLDSDLAIFYGVTTSSMNRAMKRNAERFPSDFMFQLSKEEYEALRFQFGILKRGQHSKFLPYAFTEQGVSMLSAVLRSPRAIEISILIMRAFVRMRRLVLEHDDLRKIIGNIEKRLDSHDRQIAIAFAALKSVLQPPTQLEKKEYSPDGEKRMGFGKHKGNDK
jgi:hypothetical protein